MIRGWFAFCAKPLKRRGFRTKSASLAAGGTDSGAIQLSLAGIPTVSVSVPHRYTHSPISISRVEDWKNTIKLLHAALKRITPGLLAAR